MTEALLVTSRGSSFSIIITNFLGGTKNPILVFFDNFIPALTGALAQSSTATIVMPTITAVIPASATNIVLLSLENILILKPYPSPAPDPGIIIVVK